MAESEVKVTPGIVKVNLHDVNKKDLEKYTKHLLGIFLTHVDAFSTNEQQNKAIKDLVKSQVNSAFREVDDWMWDCRTEIDPSGTAASFGGIRPFPFPHYSNPGQESI